jgi:hypothetical protein
VAGASRLNDTVLNLTTPVLLTFNEAPNIERTLAPLGWAQDIVVVDSGSTDQTCEILRRYPRVRVFQRPFTTFADQWMFGLYETGIRTDWVLALDADYLLSEALVDELDGLAPGAETDGYRASFIYCVNGVPLRGAAYPPVTVLLRRARSRVEQDGHAHRARVPGVVIPLAAPIFHDDRKSLAHWLGSQSRYMHIEAEKLRATPAASLSWPDRLRRLLVIAPLAMFVYCYLVRGGILDGRAGLFYALQRATAEAILSLYLIQRELNGGDAPPGVPKA